MKKRILYILISLTPVVNTLAQNTTNSPVSMFGIGETNMGEGGQYSGMGGVGIALRDESLLNILNPASMTAMGSNRFLIDVGVMGAYKAYTQTGIKNNSVVGNLNNIGIGCRLLPGLYGAASVTPVSSMGYAITLTEAVEGTGNSTVSSLFEGEGGLSKISLSLAYLLPKNFSIGTNLSYITGSTTQKETQSSVTVEEVSDKQALYADFGLQYKYKFARNKELVIGAIYGYSQRLAQENTLTASSSSGSSIEESTGSTPQYLPQFWGIGLAYYTPRWILSTEYKHIDWSRMESSEPTVSFRNQNKLSFGLAYKPGNIYTGRLQLQLGGGINNSYIAIKNQKKYDYYASAGARLSLNNAALTLGVKYKNDFNIPASMPRDNSISLYLNLTFSERSYRGKLK